MKPDPVTDYTFTAHGRFEMRHRGLSTAIVDTVLKSPEQRLEVRQGRHILQSRVSMGSPSKTYLVRVLVDIDRKPDEVVTAYRTSKIAKYWRDEL